MCSAYTSAMTAWLQNVYDVASSSAAAAPAAAMPDNSAATSATNPHATAASTADARLSARAGSARVSQTASLPIAKYSG